MRGVPAKFYSYAKNSLPRRVFRAMVERVARIKFPGIHEMQCDHIYVRNSWQFQIRRKCLLLEFEQFRAAWSISMLKPNAIVVTYLKSSKYVLSFNLTFGVPEYNWFILSRFFIGCRWGSPGPCAEGEKQCTLVDCH